MEGALDPESIATKALDESPVKADVVVASTEMYAAGLTEQTYLYLTIDSRYPDEVARIVYAADKVNCWKAVKMQTAPKSGFLRARCNTNSEGNLGEEDCWIPHVACLPISGPITDSKNHVCTPLSQLRVAEIREEASEVARKITSSNIKFPPGFETIPGIPIGFLEPGKHLEVDISIGFCSNNDAPASAPQQLGEPLRLFPVIHRRLSFEPCANPAHLSRFNLNREQKKKVDEARLTWDHIRVNALRGTIPIDRLYAVQFPKSTRASEEDRHTVPPHPCIMCDSTHFQKVSALVSEHAQTFAVRIDVPDRALRMLHHLLSRLDVSVMHTTPRVSSMVSECNLSVMCTQYEGHMWHIE